VRALLGRAYGRLAALRVAAYRAGILPRARLHGPVVSVGNLSVGGSGKTPVVQRVAEILRDAGLPVAVLSRGYRGSFAGDALVVSDGSSVLASAAVAGDEPVMLARALPGVVVAVGRRRDVVGRAVEARLGPRVHVLDDGFQHLRLERDLDLLCLDVGDLEDQPLPFGRLREAPGAVGRADLVLLTRLEAASEAALAALEQRLGPERTFRVRRRPNGFVTLDGASAPQPTRAFLLAGIARPERFDADVRASGAAVVGRALFRDHHAFQPHELRAAQASAREAGADAVVTTAKDAVRLPPSASDPPVLVFRIVAEIEDEPRFRERLLRTARRAA
jgi:tetraacyldisaccharide 4'-kinase